MIATENPIEQEGTFPLPEAQLDRFALQTGARLPDRGRGGRDRARAAARPSARRRSSRVVSPTTCARCSAAVEDVYVDELLLRWIVELVRATREVEGVAIGASVRGSLTLERTARAWALLHGRDHVVPEDVELLFLPVLGHRLLLTASFLAETRALGRDEALGRIRARCLELAPPPGAGLGPRLSAMSARERRTFPLVPRRRPDGSAVRRPAEPPPRPRHAT